jgi:branched-chain amino acid transport system ATP-binding protein
VGKDFLIPIIDRVSFTVEAGEFVCLLGPNGCGKTTLLRVVAGAIAPDRGEVLLDGAPLRGEPHHRARAGVVRTLQPLALAPDMTALEHVLSGMEPVRTAGLGRTLARTPRAREEERAAARAALDVLRSLDLEHLAALPAADLGVGERRLVQVARALAANPRALLLDEPSAGLDFHETRRLLVTLARAKNDGATIVLVAHDLWLVRAVADRVTVLDAGAVIAEGTPDEVAADPAVRDAYLG